MFKKSQFIGEVIKYVLVVLFSAVVLISGYMFINSLKTKSCDIDSGKFEISVKGLDEKYRFGESELLLVDSPCNIDRVYFIDLSADLNSSDFSQFPIIKDAIDTKSGNNVFLVGEHKVQSSFNAGSITLQNGSLCVTTDFAKIKLFVEGRGKSVKIMADQNQPTC